MKANPFHPENYNRAIGFNKNTRSEFTNIGETVHKGFTNAQVMVFKHNGYVGFAEERELLPQSVLKTLKK